MTASVGHPANPSANQVLGRTAPNTVTFNAGNAFTATYQLGHPNIDAAVNQCALLAGKVARGRLPNEGLERPAAWHMVCTVLRSES